MELFKRLNDKVKNLNWIDAKLISIVGLCFGLIVVKLIPGFLTINIWWFVVIGALCWFRVLYVLFSKK